ncbi:GNAT family N-acetyltransferase [Devosia sp. XK-2]|uniref:GNAT family N-acetyltransferase n=1 Tax=Devosia sp. XK-2 TaxID=3126689 RepID=UPI0030D07A8E
MHFLVEENCMQESQNVSVVRAITSDKAVIANLIQLYLYDMTADLPFPVGRDGRFEYDFFERFWQHPYLIFSNSELAGFAFVVDGSPISNAPNRHFMAEFFVLKAYRGKGVGSEAFRQILEHHPGLWQLGVIEKNGGASAFWSKVVAPCSPNSYPHHFDGEDWLVYEFEVA